LDLCLLSPHLSPANVFTNIMGHQLEACILLGQETCLPSALCPLHARHPFRRLGNEGLHMSPTPSPPQS
jgi:hypothetical protein